MTELATSNPAALPAVYVPPALDIGAEDIALPRIKLGQKSSKADVSLGQIYSSTSEDDAEVLYDPKNDEQGVLIHVLAMKRGKSVSADGQLITFDYDDPDAPSDAWVTYDYVLCLPEVDEILPFKWLFTKSARPVARQINTVLARNGGTPPWEFAFRVTTVEKQNDKGRYSVPRVLPAEAEPAHIAASAKLAQMIAGSATERSAPAGAAEPAI